MYNANVTFKSPMDEIKGLAMLELMGARAIPTRHFWMVTGMDNETRMALYDLCATFQAW